MNNQEQTFVNYIDGSNIYMIYSSIVTILLLCFMYYYIRKQIDPNPMYGNNCSVNGLFFEGMDNVSKMMLDDKATSVYTSSYADVPIHFYQPSKLKNTNDDPNFNLNGIRRYNSKLWWVDTNKGNINYDK